MPDIANKLLKTFKTPIFGGMLALTLLISFSYYLRVNDFNNTVATNNLDATFHTLLTVTALSEAHEKNNYFLPTVTLGAEQDKNIPWGAALPTKTGDYIYASFPPIGFLAPHFWLKTLSLAPTVQNIANFNFILGGVTLFFLFFLLKSILCFYGAEEWVAVGGALIGSSVGIFSREALQSQGVVYWNHSLYQPIMAAFLLMIYKHISPNENTTHRFTYTAIVCLAFVLALTEWTGYIFNIGLFLCLLIFRKKITKDFRTLSISIAVATIISGLLTVFHFGLALGFEPTLKALLSRGAARSASNGNIFDLLNGYLLSYGIFIYASVVSVFLIYRAGKFHSMNQAQLIVFIFICSLFPLLENILLLNHATSYSFDRLKFVFPASFLLAFGFYFSSKYLRAALSILLVIAGIFGYMDYRNGINRLSDWSSMDLANRHLKDKITEIADLDCSILATNLDVRGYANLLFHRGIYELKSMEEADLIFKNAKACSLIYLEGQWSIPPYFFFPKYDRAYITNASGKQTVILSE
ncbi:hypothetical protein [Pseudomonas koreensis]|uniref:hypothetical protein n=1 Tax=Pseudomonas koreensis TaxID=198620 RepID=UPI00382B7242